MDDRELNPKATCDDLAIYYYVDILLLFLTYWGIVTREF